MDDLAEQLDMVEASIENTSPIPAGHDMFDGNDLDIPEDHQPLGTEETFS